ncbi:MAG: hypothetical protein GC196_16010, partial [Hyphomonas sp.]|nr:hypothetical protein [Hyphomonas sp.]
MTRVVADYLPIDTSSEYIADLLFSLSSGPLALPNASSSQFAFYFPETQTTLWLFGQNLGNYDSTGFPRSGTITSLVLIDGLAQLGTANFLELFRISEFSLPAASFRQMITDRQEYTVPGEVGGSAATTVNIAPGDTVNSRIEVSGDQDWFRIQLQAGVTYEFRLNGVGSDALDDPYLEVMSSAGVQLSFDDDSGAGLNSLLRFTPTTSGTYYINAREFASGIGNYALTVTEANTIALIEAIFSGDDVFEGNDAYQDYDVIYGYGGNDFIRGGIGANYVDGGEGNDTVILTAIPNTSFMSGVLLGGSGFDTLRLEVSGFEQPPPPGSGRILFLNNTSISGFERLEFGISSGSDIYFSAAQMGTAITSRMVVSGSGSNTDRLIFIIETSGQNATYSLNDLQLSTQNWGTNDYFALVVGNQVQGGFNLTGSAHQDILQASTSVFATDNLFGLGGNDILVGGYGNDNLYGGEGNDMLYGGLNVAALPSGNDNLYGEGGDDQLFGDGGNDNLFGGQGNDTLLGGAGEDNLHGGAGADTLNGGANNDNLYGDAQDTFIGGDGYD